jgi:hypothetical protein
MSQINKQKGGIMSEVLLTPSVTARVVKKSEGWVRLAASTGKLPCIVTTTGRRLFRESDVLQFMQKMGEKDPDEAA